MSALTSGDLSALNVQLRTNTAFGRLGGSEVDAVLAAMTAAGYVINSFGSTGSFISSQADFAQLAMALRSVSPASRLTLSEVETAVNWINTGAVFPISRPSALGVA
jgi:hypothetical protein